MKENGVIVESHSHLDFRVLNEHTVKDSYPLPRIDRTLEALSGAQWFCTMDLASGFWQIPLKAENMEKTVFATTGDLYEFTVMLRSRGAWKLF
jgi:hypothetical protein